jgi:hypothetical protein
MTDFLIRDIHLFSDKELTSKINTEKKRMNFDDTLTVIALDPMNRSNTNFADPSMFVYTWRTLKQIKRFCETLGFYTLETGVFEKGISFKWIGQKMRGAKV